MRQLGRQGLVVLLRSLQLLQFSLEVSVVFIYFARQFVDLAQLSLEGGVATVHKNSADKNTRQSRVVLEVIR